MLKIRFFVFQLVIMLSLGTVSASHDIFPTGAKAQGMGGASITNNDIWSAFNNQAGLADFRNIGAGLIYENKFLMKEMGVKAAIIALPVGSGTFGLSLSQFGFNLYNENKVGLAYAMPLSSRLNAGIQIDYLMTQLAENYGKKGVFTFEIGLLAKLTDRISLGAHVFNPISMKLTDDVEERIPAIIKFGLKYKVNNAVEFLVETEKDINHKAVFRLGIEYMVVDNIYVRVGAANNPSLFSFGFGVQMKNFKIDLGSSRHNTLGYSPALSLMYNFNKN
ncbi:MAG: hypothetical protein PHT69_04590 [Bacteroidales bacterium]|nr:hypothetical protein [Bacteroidales bacterium]